METITHSIDAPGTIKISELIHLLEKQQKEFGNLPIYISDGQGELPMTSAAARFSDILAFKKKHGHQEVMDTYNGRFFILSNL